MKSTLLNLVCLSMALSFAVACGKKESSGSKGPQTVLDMNQYTGNQGGEVAYNQLLAWYNSSDSTPVSHFAFTRKTGNLYFNFTKNICGTGVLNFLCEKPTECFIRNNNGVMKGLPIMGGNQGLRYDGCNITTINVYSKAQDQGLKDAILGKSGKFLMKHLTRQSGSIYTVFFANSEGALNPSAAYQINTSLPAILNPVMKQEAGQETRLIYLQIFQ
jgi:hypothetical protein